MFIAHDYWLKMRMNNGENVYGGLRVVLSMNASMGCHFSIAQV